MSNITAEVLSFIEEIGLDYECLNLPRIAGRIMGLLLVTTDPLSSQQIASTLQISLGSVSTNINLLLQMGVVEKKSLIGDRINYYILASNSNEKQVMDMLSTTISRQAIFIKYWDVVKDDEIVKLRFKDSIESLDILRKFYEHNLSSSEKI
ncbi:transcriptional regulator [Brevibacillus fluminis]|uniref:Transcriptional regulator n=1 Tax=Brevibacillus fluminis TaxID=511487 RepID=A0A3M8CZN4_9BACL|nr:transcriptional regulator [Brevibacillus fluminis]RNB81286.1 transcriptional regulator [Brevibacillus fluminis]